MHRAERPAARRPTVVLLHASAGSARQWTALAEQLQTHFAVHAIDLHGHGVQPAWSGSGAFTLQHDAQLVEPLLRSAGRVHLVGHSFGGAVALQLAAAHPRAVASFAAFEPMAYHWLMADAHERDTDAMRAALAMAGTAHVIGDALLHGEPHEAGRAFVDFWSGADTWQQMTQGQRDAVARRMRAVHRQCGAVFHASYRRDEIARVAAPMLLLSGECTVPLGRHVAAALRAALPRAEHATVPGAGHMGPVTHAEAVNRRIAGFLRAQLADEADADAGEAPAVAQAA